MARETGTGEGPPPIRDGWKTVSKYNYPEGTIARLVIPDYLEGRSRPSGIFDAPLLPGTSRGPTTTVEEILLLPIDHAPIDEGRRDQLGGTLATHFRRYRILPHARLVAEIFYTNAGGPLPHPTDELNFMSKVEEIVALIPEPAMRSAVIDYWGLFDFKHLKPKEIGNKDGREPAKVSASIQRALGAIRESREGDPLRAFLTLSESLIATQLCGIIFLKDLPHVHGTLQDLNLSGVTLQQLQSAYSFIKSGKSVSLDAFLIQHFEDVSAAARNELHDKLIGRIKSHATLPHPSDPAKRNKPSLADILNKFQTPPEKPKRSTSEERMRALVDSLLSEGFQSSEAILEELIRRRKMVLGLPPKDWRVAAMIAWVLTHQPNQ